MSAEEYIKKVIGVAYCVALLCVVAFGLKMKCVIFLSAVILISVIAGLSYMFFLDILEIYFGKAIEKEIEKKIKGTENFVSILGFGMLNMAVILLVALVLLEALR